MAEALSPGRQWQSLVWVIGRACVGVLCISPPTVASAQPGRIENTPWALTAVVGTAKDARRASAGLLLDSSEGRAYGSAGCNEFSARYRITARELTFRRITYTRKRCPDPDVMKLEDAYLAALPRVRSWRLQGTALSLRGAGGRPLLTFERSKPARGRQKD